MTPKPLIVVCLFLGPVEIFISVEERKKPQIRHCLRHHLYLTKSDQMKELPKSKSIFCM